MEVFMTVEGTGSIDFASIRQSYANRQISEENRQKLKEGVRVLTDTSTEASIKTSGAASKAAIGYRAPSVAPCTNAAIDGSTDRIITPVQQFVGEKAEKVVDKVVDTANRSLSSFGT